MSLTKKTFRWCALASGLALLTVRPAWAQGGFLSSLEKDVTGLVSLVKPSLVTINTIQTIKARSMPVPDKQAKLKQSYQLETISRIGSGVIFDREGHVVTSASAVAGGNEFQIILTDDRKLKGELVGLDPDLNLAVLKVDATDLVPARLGNSDQLKAGSWVIILGNSYGLPTAVAVGLFNGIRPDGFIQMSASVAPGNSGGPVLNSRGEVIGLVSAKVSEASNISIITDEEGAGVKIVGSQGRIDLPSASISLAMPINQVKQVAQQIIEHGTVPRGFLGVYIEDQPGQEGVFISDIVDNSPADQAGFKPGDMLVHFNGQKVNNTEEFRKLVEKTAPQAKIDAKVLRSGQLISLTATMGAASPPDGLGFRPDWDFSSLARLFKLKEWDVIGEVYWLQKGYNQKQAQEIKQYLQEARQQLLETQKASAAYKSTRLEKRISELEQQLEEYKAALEQLRKELEEVKASKERP